MIKSIILLVTALILSIILMPIGFIFGILPKKNWVGNVSNYFESVALSIDQFGNTICKDLFNTCLIRDDSRSFGNPDETISSVLGKNKIINNLTFVGKALDWVLNKIDPGHAINSIDNSEGYIIRQRL